MLSQENVLSRKSVRICLALALVFNISYLVWLIFKPGDSSLSISADNIVQTLGYLLGAIFCFVGLTKSQYWNTDQSVTRLPAAIRWIPILFGIGVFFQAVGQIFYTYYDLIKVNPFPSWADAGFLGGYVPLILAILLLPAQRHSGIARSRIFLDALMVIVAVITFSWYFVLGPSLLQLNEDLFTKLVAGGYPFFDLIMVVCLVLLSFRSMQPQLQVPLRMFSIALGIIVIADTAYTYQTLHNTYVPGNIVDIGWPLGYMLLGLAIQFMNIIWSRQDHKVSAKELERIRAQEEANWFRRQGVHLPYVLIPAVLILAGLVWFRVGDSTLAQGVYLGGVILIALILLRQVVAMREIRSLNKQLQIANSRLESLATTDPLTGLPNHRSLMETLEQELERSGRYEHAVSLLFLDIDHFKALNDSYGHPVGDAVLREFAKQIRSNLRQPDIAGRWGGEEFVAVLPETDALCAVEVAERIRAAVGNHIFSESGLRITCSIGVATYPIIASERDSLIAQADQAMYAAKHLGRNQVRLANEAVVAALEETGNKSSSREETALSGIVEALSGLVEARDNYTGQHTQRVGNLTTRIALKLGVDTPEAGMISIAGRLHDIGKIAIPDAILHKPGSLTEEEWAVMRTHAAVGGEMIGRIPALRGIAATVRAHHERWDGMGYPDQLAAEEIPLGARIIAAVDAYEAITTDRPYQKARDPEWALAELQRCSGKQFDPRVVEAMIQVLSVELGLKVLAEVA